VNLDEQNRVRGHEFKSEPIPTDALSSRSVADNHLQLVSIVIPTYNQAEYLAIAIDSVLEQDYPNLEIIVVDDGSTDGTSEVLKKYAEKLTCISQKNAGQSCALNHGWSKCKGEVLGYLSSDDRLLPNAISKLMTTLAREPSIILVYCDFDLIDSTGKVIRSVQTEKYSKKRLVEDLLCLPGPGALFKRDVFNRIGGWRESLRQCPDFEYWLRAASIGDFSRVGEILAQFRIHAESTSFRQVSVERCDEISVVVDKYCDINKNAPRSRMTGKALLMAAKNHAQSGRYITAVWRFTRALTAFPSLLFSMSTWRMFLSGCIRRTFYYFRWLIQRDQQKKSCK
jgi:glycosyltransferase involved in cell wall biosynthesis